MTLLIILIGGYISLLKALSIEGEDERIKSTFREAFTL